MKIAVINGSPKGKYSVTLQTVRYLEIRYPEHEFTVLHAGQKIKALEKDFSQAKELLESSDAVIFSYPVYTFLAPSQLHYFIRLMKENNVDVKDKYVTQISTSKHFYDVTAHKYIEENTLDLGMRYIRGLSADMEDLLEEKGRNDADKFFERFMWSTLEEVYTSPKKERISYNPVIATSALKNENKTINKNVILLTDETDTTSSLSKMIERFTNVSNYCINVVNISDFPFSGGCLGCLRCAVSEKCVYKDGFEDFLRNSIQKSDAIVYAFNITDHSMGTRFKMYDDRSFCNGHRTVTVGMPVAYLVSGNYSDEINLQTIIEAKAETGGNFLCGVATDEYDTDKQIDKLAKTLTFALETQHTAPANFWGVGGMKIFRDLIYQMRGMMKADHKFYKKQGIYDFPQKNKGKSLLMYGIGAMLSSKAVLSKMGNKMNEGMLMPYEQMLKKLKNNKLKKRSKKKNLNQKSDSDFKENKYEIYAQKLEILGLSRPIYKDEKITITYMGNRYYYIFENHIGLGVPILAKKMMEIIENPDKFFAFYCTLSDKTKNLLTILIQNPNLEEMFTKVKERTEAHPEQLTPYNAEVEKMIFEKYGHPKSLYRE